MSTRAARGGISRRTVVAGLVIGVPASVLFLWLASRGLDVEAVWDTLKSAQPAFVALALCAMALVYVLQAERWRRIAAREAPAPYRAFLAMVVGGVAVNNVVPGRPGELLRGYWLSRISHAPVARAFATVIVDRASDVIVLVAMLAVSLPFVDHPDWLRNLMLVAVPLTAVIVAVLAGAWWYTHRSARGRARGVPGAVERSRLRHHASGLVRGAASLVHGRDVAVVLGLSVGAWLAWAGSAWAVATALGVELTGVEILFVTAVLNLGVAIPSSPGFVGTYQWLSVAALGLFGVTRDSAFAFSILMQAVWFIPTTLAGIALATWAGTHGFSLRAMAGRAPERAVVSG